MAKRDLKRLAEAVVEARSDRRESREEFAARGGISPKALQRIERVEVETPRGSTLAGLDRAAGWPKGTARKIWILGIEPPRPEDRDDGPEVAPVLETPADVEPSPETAPPSAVRDRAESTSPSTDADARQQLIDMSYEELGRVAALIEAAEGTEAAEAFMRNALRVRRGARGLPQLGENNEPQGGDARSAG